MFLYRLCATLIAPVVAVIFLLRCLRGRETLSDLHERLGGSAGTPGAVWLHGASNGELTSARPLIEAMLSAFPDHALVVTANTTTGRDLVAGWGLGRVHPRLAPLDYRWALARFRARWRPKAMVFLENELWPNRLMTARAPVLCVAARMSARSAARWGRLGGLTRRLLGRIDWLAPQDQGSAARFVALGVDKTRLGPVISLKPAVSLPQPPATELADLARIFSRPDTVLAASTHAGEDAVVLHGFATARAANPALKLILAPRHPRRAEEIATLVRQSGLNLTIRSGGAAPGPKTAVYLADTLGEMALWYRLAGVTFVGGSLVNKGGHTPFEPAQAGSAILHGPHVANFQDPYHRLDAADAAVCVTDSVTFADTLALLSGTRPQTAMAQLARQVLAQTDGEAVQQVTGELHKILTV